MSLKNTFSLFIFILLSYACSDKPELIENNDPSKYEVVKDVLWASPGGFDLTMDIYTPKSGKSSYPVLIMYHGGGWLINDNSIMDQASAYFATNSEYVICNVNYRLLVDNDNTVTLNQIVDDVFGAVLWIKENIHQYKGNKEKIAVTGDSAGGHLSAMIVNLGTRISSQGFKGDILGFSPSYLPPGLTAEDVARQNGMEVQAAILSYGAFDVYKWADGLESMKNPFWAMGGSMARGIFGDEFNAQDNSELYQAVSPIYHIPDSSERKLPPQLLTVGSKDDLVTPESVETYYNKLLDAGQSAQYWVHEGRPHAFLDSGSNSFLGISFEKDAPPALDVMIDFLNEVFYDKKIL